MATVLDLKLRPTVKRIIDKYGKLIQYTYVTPTNDKISSSKTEATDVADFKVTPPAAYMNDFRSSLTWTEVKMYVLATPIYLSIRNPRKGDRLLIDGTVYFVHDWEAFYSGELISAYVLQLRR